MNTALDIKNTRTLKALASFPVRQMDFDLPEDLPSYWFNNNPVLTMLVTAFSATFPEGEKGFIRSVRAFQDKLDPKLKADVSAFIGQESHHGKEHQALNDLMTKRGYNANKISDFIKEGVAFYESKVSKLRFLAHTCAAEHLTAIFAEQILENPERLNVIHEAIRPMLIWHAIEEAEHKSVAFDVFQAQAGSYWMRISELMIMTMMMSFFTTKHTIELLMVDKQLSNVKALREAAIFVYGKQGFMRGLLPKYLDYYRPGFHPSDRDTNQLLAKGLKLLASYVGDKAKVA